MGRLQQLQLQLSANTNQTCTWLPSLLKAAPQLLVLDLSCCAHKPSDLLVLGQYAPGLQELLLHCQAFTTLSGRRIRHGNPEWGRHGGNTRYQPEHLAALARLPHLQLLEVPLPTTIRDDASTVDCKWSSTSSMPWTCIAWAAYVHDYGWLRPQPQHADACMHLQHPSALGTFSLHNTTRHSKSWRDSQTFLVSAAAAAPQGSMRWAASPASPRCKRSGTASLTHGPPAAAIAALSGLTRLKELRCEAGRAMNPIGGDRAETIEEARADCWGTVLSHMPHLTRLELVGSGAGDPLLRVIGSSAPQLQRFVFQVEYWGSSSSKDGADAIAHVGHIELLCFKGLPKPGPAAAAMREASGLGVYAP